MSSGARDEVTKPPGGEIWARASQVSHNWPQPKRPSLEHIFGALRPTWAPSPSSTHFFRQNPLSHPLPIPTVHILHNLIPYLLPKSCSCILYPHWTASFRTHTPHLDHVPPHNPNKFSIVLYSSLFSSVSQLPLFLLFNPSVQPFFF